MKITEYDLLKFCKEDFKLEDINYIQKEIRFKPCGLWVTLKEVDNWEDWCEAENFNIPNLRVIKHLKFKEGANILVITNGREFEDFEKRFSSGSWGIDWIKVYKAYQGILITKYFWQYRMANWYYPWDCVSGCIWDTSCLEETFSEINPKIEKLLES